MEMSSLQTQISAIMEVLAKAAVAEISQLLQEDAAALHLEIRLRNEEIRSLKSRLTLTESRLKSLTGGGCSVGVQVHISDTAVTAHGQETLVLTAPVKDVVLEEKPHVGHVPDSQPLKHEEPRSAPHAEEEELSSLELQMKIEQVEELVDHKLSQVQHDGDTHVWSSEKELDHHDSLIEPEQHSQGFPDPYMMMEEDLGASSALSALSASAVLLENDRNNDTDLNLLHQESSHRRSPRSSVSDRLSASHSSSQSHSQSLYVPEEPRLQTGPKPFRCEECGKSFTQRTRLITHRRVHTGEKPFRCQLCGKMFSRQDNCLRHMRLHSGQRW